MSPSPSHPSPSPFTYTADLVAALLERHLDGTEDLDEIDCQVDLATALALLERHYPGAYALATAYAQGHTEDEMAEALGWDRKAMRDTMTLLFTALANLMNGEQDCN